MLNLVSGQLSEPVAPVTNSYESIATVTVGGGGSSYVEFTSIPSTYKHLQIRYILKGTAGNWNTIQYNGDTGSNYTYHALYGYGTGVAAGAGTSLTGWNFNYNNSVSDFQAGVIDILDYTNTSKNKTGRCLHGYDANGSGIIELNSGAWLSTAAISSIKINGATAFAQYSSFALYGIKG